jgi:hypothetical protein
LLHIKSDPRAGDTASKLLARHDLNAVGYWVPENAPAWDNTFIYIWAHPSREEAKKNWAAMHADPGFQEMAKSEQTEKLVEKVDSTYMHPTDFSPMSSGRRNRGPVCHPSCAPSRNSIAQQD